MCTWAVAGQMALQAWGIRQRNKAAAQAANMKMTGAVQEMNYAFKTMNRKGETLMKRLLMTL